MKVAVIAVSAAGLRTALRIGRCCPGARIYASPRLLDAAGLQEHEGITQLLPLEGDLKTFTGSLWGRRDALVFVMASGIAVRVIAPYLKGKHADPAVVVVDDSGTFAVSLLSGHLGGANDLAEQVAAAIGAVPVITTSTDRHGIVSFDLLARRCGWTVERLHDLKKISLAQLEDREIDVYVDENVHFDIAGPWRLDRTGRELARARNGAVLVSSRLELPAVPEGVPFVVLRPRSVTAGVGCRRGVEGARIIAALEETFTRAGRSIASLEKLATVNIKGREPGLLQAAEHFGVPMQLFGSAEIAPVEHLFTVSPFVRERVGAGAVAEPCAFLGSGKGAVIAPKNSYPGVTVALAERTVRCSREAGKGPHEPAESR